MSRFAGATKAEESFREWQYARRIKRDQYWQAVYDMRVEYLQEHKDITDLTARPTIHHWAEERYGFKMGVDGQGNYTQDHEVVDPKRYMLFQLKYMK